MKERELRKHQNCSYCEKPIGHTQVPGFFTVEIVGFKLEVDALRRQSGLGMMLSPALAMHVGPDEELATEFQRQNLTMCWTCWAELWPQPQADDCPQPGSD